MSNLAFVFFCAYILLQIMIPLRRYVAILFFKKGKGDLMSDVYRHFSWTMLTLAHDGYVDFSVYDKMSGKILERIHAKDHVILYQYQKLLNCSPSAQTQYAHYLYNNLKIDRKDVGISCYCEVNFNARGWERIMNDDVDLAREKIHVFFPYRWY